MGKQKQHIITAIKFICFAVPGGFLLVVGLLMTVGELLGGPHPNRMKDLVVFPLAAALGFPMTMFGLGLWGQWRYALVFISIPISFFIIEIIPFAGKLGVVFAAFPALAICWLVKDYYDKAASHWLERTAASNWLDSG